MPYFDPSHACFGHFKNIDSLGYANLSNVDTFHYTMSKKSEGIINSLLSVAQQSSSRRPVSVFQSSVFTQKLRFSQGQQILSTVFLQVTGPRHSFLGKRVENLMLE